MDASTEPKRRPRPLNYIQMAKNILDGYSYGLSHGFQKDAIQNGWDARRSSSRAFIKENWEFTVELTKIGSKEVIILIDKGTTGLTGSMTSEDIHEDTDLPQDERWARWESMAFQKEGGSSLGARGQGKMVFIAASEVHKIYYDSLRDDGTYRYGWTQATIRDCDVWHLDGEAAKTRIKEDFELSPLREEGTRVIIPEPVEELREAIKDGSLLKFIEETWWPIILKYEVKIRVTADGKNHTATVPSLFPIDVGKESKSFKTWAKENITVKFQNQNYTIKRICFACDLNNEQEEWVQGVACFRIGMKVETIPFTTRSFEKNFFGYAEFDNRTDEELRKLEMPNHYNFKPTGLWRVIKEKIKDEMEAFGNDKLGLGIDRRAAENTKRTGAEIRALDIFKMITKNWTLTYGSTGPIGGTAEQIDKNVKPMGVILQEFKFPNETNTPRVEFGDKIEDFKVVAFNKTSSLKEVILSVYVYDEGGETIISLINTQFTLNQESEVPHGPFGFTIDEEKFQAGKYTLRCVLLDAESKTREKIDTITRHFWVASEPKLPSPFDLEGKDLPDEDWEWSLQNQGDSRYTLFYNQMHPVYLENNETEESLGKYIGELCCLAALQLYLREIKRQSIQSGEDALPVKGPIDPSIITGGDPELLYKEISKQISTIRKAVREL